ncbi:hypothetical protein [Streptomyces chiangmaiensis]|uniref:Uncharacterized protein n=1 Tax=Streptomyces chiangmaiensis TaxID=766497 RepID=A0ABU7FR55_9ACTN|nr:hypothetical protein [Streptomyces chiangmaiensis]MED7826313.1 hypothetical protein [Streptomyces chiangmaiensis]
MASIVHRTATVNGLEVLYREAGDPQALTRSSAPTAPGRSPRI